MVVTVVPSLLCVWFLFLFSKSRRTLHQFPFFYITPVSLLLQLHSHTQLITADTFDGASCLFPCPALTFVLTWLHQTEVKHIVIILNQNPSCLSVSPPQLESLQQTRGQLLKVSEQISSTMRSSQEQLAAKLQQSQSQLDEARTQLDQTKTELDCARSQLAHLQTQRDQAQTQLLQSKSQLEQSRSLCEQTRAQNNLLHIQLEQLSAQLKQARVHTAQLQTQLRASEKSMETSNESLLIKVDFFPSVTVLKIRFKKCIGGFHLWSCLPAGVWGDPSPGKDLQSGASCWPPAYLQSHTLPPRSASLHTLPRALLFCSLPSFLPQKPTGSCLLF